MGGLSCCGGVGWVLWVCVVVVLCEGAGVLMVGVGGRVLVGVSYMVRGMMGLCVGGVHMWCVGGVGA